LRLDLIGQAPEELYARIPQGVQTVATCRGEQLSDEQRGLWLKQAIKLGASYVDLELEAELSLRTMLIGQARAKGCTLIVSHHDFHGTPDRHRLSRVLEDCYLAGGIVAKIATRIRSRAELLELLTLYDLPGRKVVLGMGKEGRISRIMAPYLGSEFTFASAAAGEETAPGQLDYRQLTEIYKVITGP